MLGFYLEHFPEVEGTALRHPDRNEVLFVSTFGSPEEMRAFYETRRTNDGWRAVTAPHRPLLEGCEDTVYKVLQP